LIVGGGGGGGDGNKLFIGNLGWETTTDDLYSAFGQYGQVQDAIVMTGV
jgi:RNA recognition motif-containing protein